MASRLPLPHHITPALTQLRKGAGSLFVDGFFNTISRLGKLHPLASPAKHDVEVIRDLRYGPLPAHRLDVWRPADTSKPRPVALYVHGGGFRILSKDTHWIMALLLARHGYVVFTINYRLAPKHPFPAAVQDVALALPFVLDHAKEYGGDPKRLVLAGESAGGNLVTALTRLLVAPHPLPWTRPVYDAGVVPLAVLPACGMLQVTDSERLRTRKPHMRTFVADRIAEVSHAYLGAAATDSTALSPELRDLADPLLWLEDVVAGRLPKPERPLPPMHALVGTADPLLDDTRRLVGALQALGVQSEAAYYPGEVHAFHAFIHRPAAQKAWKAQLAFLDRVVGVVK